MEQQRRERERERRERTRSRKNNGTLVLCLIAVLALLNNSSQHYLTGLLGVGNTVGTTNKSDAAMIATREKQKLLFGLKSKCSILRVANLWNRKGNTGKVPSDCTQWAVVTTGRAWSENQNQKQKQKPESIRRILNLRHWCLVIVGDDDVTGTANDDEGYLKLARENERVIYLSPSEQRGILNQKQDNHSNSNSNSNSKSKSNSINNKNNNPLQFQFARKNIGYLFALGHGAKVVFDFDDSSVLKSLEDGSIPPPFFYSDEDIGTGTATATSTSTSTSTGTSRFGFDRTVLLEYPSTTRVNMVSQQRYVTSTTSEDNNINNSPLSKLKSFHRLVFNPYIYYWVDIIMRPGTALPDNSNSNSNSDSASKLFPWREEYPYDKLKNDVIDNQKKTPTVTITATGDLPYNKIGVIQSLSTSTTTDDNSNSNSNSNHYEVSRTLPLMVPPGSYSPYNSEATVHLYHAFWGLYLPFSVGTKAAADVYRSYITQRLMKDIGLCVIFRPPMVYRDTVSNGGGKQRQQQQRQRQQQREQQQQEQQQQQQQEEEFHDQSKRLLDFLDQWSSDAPTLKERILDLWQSLHFNKFKFIGLGDVEAVREWLAALDTIGYQFPDIPVDIDPGSQQSQEQQQQHRSHSSQLSLYPRPHPQPSMVGGQPFRAFPHINKKLVAKGTIGDEDDQLILKLILQTKDEWPLIKSWVTYHGQLIGFDRLYILDSSEDVRCTSFLTYARDVLGANVIFSDNDSDNNDNDNDNDNDDIDRVLLRSQSRLNELAKLFAGSADFVLTMNTDEYVFVPDKDKLQLQPQPLLEAFQGYVTGFRTDPDHPLRQLQQQVNVGNVGLVAGDELTNLQVGYLIHSIPSRDVCQKKMMNNNNNNNDNNGEHAAAAAAAAFAFDSEEFPLSQIDPAPFHFKRLYDTMHPFDPGTRGYINPDGHVADDETALRTEFGVLHFHRRCHELEAASVKRALVVDHAYFAESDSDGYVKTNLEERLGLPEHHDICTRTYELNNIDGVDKAVWYLKYLHCPEQVINEYYPEGQEHGTYSDIHEFFQSAEKTFGLNAPP